MGEFVAPPCRCVWRGVPCGAPATQEDGLCDWCGTRTAEQVARSPHAVVAADGKATLGGGSATPYNHQAGRSGIPADARPSACWMDAAALSAPKEG